MEVAPDPDTAVPAKEGQFRHQAGLAEIMLLSIGIVLSGAMTSWNSGLESGFLGFIVSICVITAGYTALTLCLAELTSITAFAGGAYGYARCSIGPAQGYLFGCFELMKGCIFALCCLKTVALAISLSAGTSAAYEPLWVLVGYTVIVVVLLRGGSYFWMTMNALAVGTMLLLLLYLISGMTQCSVIYTLGMEERDHHAFNNGVGGWMEHLVHASWFYIGIELVTVAGARISNGTKVIPRAMIGSMAFFALVAFWIAAVVYFGYKADLPAAHLFQSKFPLMFGFYDHLHIPWEQSALLAVLPLFGSALGFVYASTHVAHALALSGLLNPWLKATHGPDATPARALLLVVSGQYLLFLLVFYFGLVDVLFPFTMLGACGSYIGVLSAFLTFRRRFPSMERGFSVPCGTAVAHLGITVFALVIVSVLGFLRLAAIIAPLFVGLVALFLTYYFKVSEKRQFFSTEEQEKFFKAYVLNANKRKRGRVASADDGPKCWFMRMMALLPRRLPVGPPAVVSRSCAGAHKVAPTPTAGDARSKSHMVSPAEEVAPLGP